MLNQLSIVYPKLDTVNPKWYAEFTACFTDPTVEHVEVPGVVGDLQVSRVSAFMAATREYVFSPDPDDLFDLDHLKLAVAYLDAHPEVGAVTMREERIDIKGHRLDSTPMVPLIQTRVFGNPMEMHCATVFRTASVQQAIHAIQPLHFQNFDWALRIYIASHYKVVRLMEVAYQYRWHDHGHRTQACSLNQIPMNQTYATLHDKGLLKLTRPGYTSRSRTRNGT